MWRNTMIALCAAAAMAALTPDVASARGGRGGGGHGGAGGFSHAGMNSFARAAPGDFDRGSHHGSEHFFFSSGFWGPGYNDGYWGYPTDYVADDSYDNN